MKTYDYKTEMRILTGGWQSPHRHPRRLHLPMKNIDVVSAFYGLDYARLFTRTCLPSLLRQVPPNLKPFFRIYTTHQCCDAIAPALKNLPYHYEVVTDPGFVQDGNHESLAACYVDSIRRAVPTLIAPADHVFGLGAFQIVDALEPGDLVVAAQVRIDQSPDNLSLMADLLARNPTNAELTRHLLRPFAHDMVRRGWALDQSQLWRIIQESADSRFATLNFADPPPLAWHGQPYMLDAWKEHPDWVGLLGVIDHQLPDLAFRHNHLLTIQDSRDFCWAEWTNPTRRVLPVPDGLKTQAMQFLDRLPVRLFF